MSRAAAIWQAVICWLFWHKHVTFHQGTFRWSPFCDRCGRHWTQTYMEETK